MSTKVDARELEAKVKEMYRDVATNPRGDFHFEMGRVMAERLGYIPSDLDRVPSEAIESFAGVGHFFVAALQVGPTGRVLGVDMTPEQLAKAERLQREHDFRNIAYLKGYIEEPDWNPTRRIA